MQQSTPPQDQETERHNSYIAIIIAIIMIAVIAAILAYPFYRKKPKEEKYKNEIAKSYHIDEKTLIKWIKHFCPADTVEKYSSSVQLFNIHDLHPYLGKPLKEFTISKTDLAAACFVSKSTLLRHFSKIPATDFQEWTGLSFDNYKNDWRVFPPQLFERLLLTYQFHYQIELFSEPELLMEAIN